jgi:hypothetical protein
MKNIYILPTDKPSRLISSGKEFTLLQKSTIDKRCKHIYITNDEEIKEGDWFYDGDGELCKYTSDYVVNPNGWNDNKKIILTTDQDLIKDGVQSIDTEFLEWFVKNPNCERVEVKKEMYMPFDGKIAFELSLDETLNTRPYYKINIPKEESKQETLEEAFKKWSGKPHVGYDKIDALNFGAKWNQEQILQFLYSEITERRDYSSSKMCEKVIEFIEQLKNKI